MVFFLVFMLAWLGVPYVVLAVFALDLAWATAIPGLWWFWQLNIYIPAVVWFVLGLMVFNRLPDPNEAGQRAVSERRRNPPPPPPRRP